MLRFWKRRLLSRRPRCGPEQEPGFVFYKRFIGDNNIDEECYGEESCDFEEVVEKFDHSEQTVGRPCLDKNGALEYLLLNLSSIPF